MKHLLLVTPMLLTAGLALAAPPPLRHSRAWVNQRLADMVACDEAYLYNDVLGGRAIHQNSMSKPEPTEAWEGNFHTQQQSYYALVKMDLYELGEHQYRAHALAALQFLADHGRTADGGWVRHNVRDGSDPTQPPGIGDGGTTEPGTPVVYDRNMQMIVACCLAWQVTGEAKYLQWVDDTLDRMEKTHLTKYPVGVNYGYTGANDYENTWCHLWGLKAFIAMARLWG